MHDPLIILPNGNAVHYEDIRSVKALAATIGYADRVVLSIADKSHEVIYCESFGAACVARDDIIALIATLRAQEAGSKELT